MPRGPGCACLTLPALSFSAGHLRSAPDGGRNNAGVYCDRSGRESAAVINTFLLYLVCLCVS